MIEIYSVVLLGVLLGQASPGPNFAAVVSCALGQGQRTANYVTLGIASAIFFWAALAACGLGGLLRAFPSILTAMFFAGGSYMCFMSWKAFSSVWSNKEIVVTAAHRQWEPAAAWRHGLMVNLTNPKSALMWGAVAAFMFSSGLTTIQVIGFAPIGFVSAVIIYGTYAAIFSRRRLQGAYAKFAFWFQCGFATLFGMTGVTLLYDGVLALLNHFS